MLPIAVPALVNASSRCWPAPFSTVVAGRVADADRDDRDQDLRDDDAVGELRADPRADQRIGEHGAPPPAARPDQREARALHEDRPQPLRLVAGVAVDDDREEHAVQLVGQPLQHLGEPLRHRPERDRRAAR